MNSFIIFIIFLILNEVRMGCHFLLVKEKKWIMSHTHKSETQIRTSLANLSIGHHHLW